MPATLDNALETAFARFPEPAERVRNPEYDASWLGVVVSATQAWQRYLAEEASYRDRVFTRQIERVPEQEAYHARYRNAWLGSAIALTYFLPPSFAETHPKEHSFLELSIQQAKGLLPASDPCFDPKDCGWVALGLTVEGTLRGAAQIERGEGRPANEVFEELKQRKQ